MQGIWKVALSPAVKQSIDLPKGSKVLCVQTQKGNPVIWFTVPDIDSNEKESRIFLVLATGYKIDEIKGNYIGTFQLTDEKGEQDLVYHVFEEF